MKNKMRMFVPAVVVLIVLPILAMSAELKPMPGMYFLEKESSVANNSMAKSPAPIGVNKPAIDLYATDRSFDDVVKYYQSQGFNVVPMPSGFDDNIAASIGQPSPGLKQRAAAVIKPDGSQAMIYDKYPNEKGQLVNKTCIMIMKNK